MNPNKKTTSKSCVYAEKEPLCVPCVGCSEIWYGEENNRFKKTPQTNADRIRAMSDEELAELLYETETQYLPIGLHVENGWPEWLKKEVGND